VPCERLRMAVITFLREGKKLDVPAGANLRKVALKAGISVYRGKDVVLNCRGNMLCGTCRVEVLDGKSTTPRSALEEFILRGRFLIARKMPETLRLSCQVAVNGDMSVRTAPAIEIDKEETKTRFILAGIFGFFGLVTAAILVILALDLVKAF
ncbi:MAG TPA: 2Fe-2S iron-sulfur cluster-binding protein, partial [Bacteroidota bacterium]